MPDITHGPVRARDLRANIQQYGFEKGVTVTVEHLLEEHSEHRVRLRQITELLDMCINQIEQMVQLSDAMKNIVEEVKRAQDSHDAE